MRRQSLYQTTLIALSALVLLGVGAFVYKELFPEYKTFQYAYKDLEIFRSTLIGEKPAPFAMGIQQIVIPDEKNGPETIDRCTSCHVAMKLPHFSPTRLALDVNSHQIYDSKGMPALESNPEYIWKQIDEKIQHLRSSDYQQQLYSQGEEKKAKEALKEAMRLEGLKHAVLEEKNVDMTKVLAMHPLIGDELRPFQYHPMEEYGCTICHSGNGRALVGERAHGPVYDEEYEKAHEGRKPKFLESDPLNDPNFAYVYNDKPGHGLIFQTTPLLVGPLLQSRCAQCHQSSKVEMSRATDRVDDVIRIKQEEVNALQKGIQHDRQALNALIDLNQLLKSQGYDETLQHLKKRLTNDHLSSQEIDALEGQFEYVKNYKTILSKKLEEDLVRILGDEAIAREALALNDSKNSLEAILKKAVSTSYAPFSLFAKERELAKAKEALAMANLAMEPLGQSVAVSSLEKGLHTHVDRLLVNYKRGQELFISQACYACHRIAGFSRSSIGPELTKIGYSYPWYIKESIVWPQADLPSSTMPNFHLDHEEVQDLMTFLMAQRGDTKTVSEVDYRISIKEWEAGKKLPFESPLNPSDILNVRSGMTIYATEGCAACHKLEGFKSDVGFAVEKETNASFIDTLQEKEWFSRLFPEHITGSRLAKLVEEKSLEIDAHLVNRVRQNSILEDIEKQHPGLIASFYSNFRFASRAKNTDYGHEPQKLEAYRERLHRVLMMYIQVYGLGRDIAPRLNWSGVFRDDEWLMGHFHNPGAYTARSIMPVIPFDDTKFYALTHMLHEVGKENRDQLKALWNVQGFNPPLAYQLLCSSCHGAQRQGNGLVSEWIYPIPKNLKNPIFLTNLTKARAIDSITHGVKGTPMPPWGASIETEILGGGGPVLSHSEISQLVDWLYQGIPSAYPQEGQEDYRKWHYSPVDVVQEMERQHEMLSPAPMQKDISLEQVAHYYFEESKNASAAVDQDLFYIRKDFYTEDNLNAGKDYFLTNCATCHGKDAAGTGLRAITMMEAKPRMLTNVPWIRSKDDMRLLRSIKYGVPGTSMIPWGDQTTSTQRMQLAMYIRHLSETQLLRGELEDLLYNQFDTSILLVEEARINEFQNLEELENAYKATYLKRQQLLIQEKKHDEDLKMLAVLYEKEMSLLQQAEERKKRDGLYLLLIEEIRHEKKLYNDLGATLIAKELSNELVRSYFQLLKDYPLSYSLMDGSLFIELSLEKEEKSKNMFKVMTQSLAAKIERDQEVLDVQKNELRTANFSEDLQKMLEEQGSLINFKTKLAIQLADADKSREQQLKYYYSIKNL